MFFRFAASLVLVVVVSMLGVLLEKRTLELRRAVSRQYYQTDLLVEQQVALRLETQRLTAPAQLRQLRSAAAPQPRSERATEGSAALTRPGAQPSRGFGQQPEPAKRLPLLRFQYPLNPEGID